MRSDEVIACVGNLHEGHMFIGPFDDYDVAEEWLEASQYDYNHYQILPLEPPVDLSKG